MRTNWILAAAVAGISATVAVGAQSATAMNQPSKDGTMSMTYTGCVESVNHGAAYLLTMVDSGKMESTHGDKAMKNHDGMAMKSDAAKPMQQGQAAMADEKMDAMSSKSFALAGSTKFGKHVGQKVFVTGAVSGGSMGTMRKDLPTLTVKTLKVIAKSCS